jgi:hypothetical protein
MKQKTKDKLIEHEYDQVIRSVSMRWGASKGVSFQTNGNAPPQNDEVALFTSSFAIQSLENFWYGMQIVPFQGGFPVNSGVGDSTTNIPPGITFSYYTLPGTPPFVANGGTTTPLPLDGVAPQGLSLSSTPISTTVPPLPAAGAVPLGFLDNTKFLALSTNSYAIVPGTETYTETTLSAQIHNADLNPFCVRDPQDDPRLATGGLVTYDPINLIYARVLFTNRSIYASYSILPTAARTVVVPPLHASFATMKKIGSRSSAFDQSTVGIGWTNTGIRWYVNRHLAYSVSNLGSRPPDYYATVTLENGGPDVSVVPVSVVVGLGTFTFLDWFRPNRADMCSPGSDPLVLLSSVPGFYRDPFTEVVNNSMIQASTNADFPALPASSFFDPTDLPQSRIFNSVNTSTTAASQGVTLHVRYLAVIRKFKENGSLDRLQLKPFLHPPPITCYTFTKE